MRPTRGATKKGDGDATPPDQLACNCVAKEQTMAGPPLTLRQLDEEPDHRGRRRIGS
jgi:hypothetical protein